VQVPRPLRVVERAAAVRPERRRRQEPSCLRPLRPRQRRRHRLPAGCPDGCPAGTGQAARLLRPAKRRPLRKPSRGRSLRRRLREQLSSSLVSNTTRSDAERRCSQAGRAAAVSEFALVRVKDDWVGFRDVFEVDGKPIGERKDRIEKLFLQTREGAVEQAAGSPTRVLSTTSPAPADFNVPTMRSSSSGQITCRGSRSGKRARTDDGVAVWKVAYRRPRSRPSSERRLASIDR